LWCVECGKQTEAIDNELSAVNSLRDTWNQYKPFKTLNIPFASIIVLCGIIPMLLLTWLTNNLLGLELNTIQGLITSLLVKAVIFSVFVPITLLGFTSISQNQEYCLRISDFRSSLRKYPAYLFFAIISSIYYIVIYLICYGLPSFSADPVLRIVWLILVNYWIAIVLPAPMIAETQEVGMLKAIGISYRHLSDVRWNIYLLTLLLFLINVLGAGFAIVGLTITIPFSLFVIRDYTRKLIDFELLTYRR